MLRILPLCLLVLLIGCARKKAAAPVVAAPVQPDTVQEDNPAYASWLPPGEGYQGRTTKQWAQTLNTNDQVERQKASEALGKLGDKGYPYLLDGMKSGSWEMRLTCMKAIDQPVMLAHAKDTLPLLQDMLRDNNSVVRRQALLRVGWFGARASEALTTLRAMADRDEDPETRRVAAEVIVGIHKTVPALIQMLQENNAEVRKQAIGRLTFIGPDGRPAVPTLQAMAASDPDPDVRRAAANALKLFR